MDLGNINKKFINLSREYFIFSIIVLMSICFLAAGFCYYSYYRDKYNKEKFLLTLTKTISVELKDILDENKNILKFFGSKIALQMDPNNLKSISNLLMENNNLEIKSMTKSYICWADLNGKVLVSGKHGILNTKDQNINIKDRKYFIAAKDNPWSLQIAKSNKSFFSHNIVLPTAMGIQNKAGKFIGYLIIGLKVDHINTHIANITNINKVNYLILDDDLQSIIPDSKTLNTKIFNKTLLAAKNEVLTTPIYFDNTKYSYLVKIEDYPLFVLLGYDVNTYQQDFLNKITLRLTEFLLVGVFCLVLLYFFRKKVISPVIALSKLALLIAKGKLDVKIPRQNSTEMFNLAKSLLLVIKYIRKTELYKQKLEIATKIARDSDCLRAEFTKNMHYEFGSYFKEIFIYSDLINKYFINNTVINKQMIEYAKKIQELVMIIRNKTSNNLELSYFDLNTVLEEAIKINMKNAFLKGINIRTHFKKILDIYADQLRIKQILISLIRQSIENSRKDSEIFITTDMRFEENNIWFETVIIDQSFGLGEAELSIMEEKFNSGGGDVDIIDFEFTKMKLEFIEKLISMHYGKMRIINKLHKGRTIQLLFPLLSKKDDASKKNVFYFAEKIKTNPN